MKTSTALLAGVIALALTGCVSQSQFLENKQGMAMQTALSRGQFDLNCPQASPCPHLQRSRPACLARPLGEWDSKGRVYDRRAGLR